MRFGAVSVVLGRARHERAIVGEDSASCLISATACASGFRRPDPVVGATAGCLTAAGSTGNRPDRRRSSPSHLQSPCSRSGLTNHSARFLIRLCACLALTQCSQSVTPAPFDSDVPLDAAGPDARTDAANAPDAAGARDGGADDVSFQRASVVWVTQSGGFRATGRILSPTPVDTELPTPVGGCEVIAPRLSAMVSDGTLSIEWNGQQRQIPFGENREYYDVLMPMAFAPGELVTARFSGSSTHPDFLLEGRMPPAMPAVLTPSQRVLNWT